MTRGLLACCVLVVMTFFLSFFLLDDSAGWYQRWENNGWRLVSDRVSASSKPRLPLLCLAVKISNMVI